MKIFQVLLVTILSGQIFASPASAATINWTLVDVLLDGGVGYVYGAFSTENGYLVNWDLHTGGNAGSAGNAMMVTDFTPTFDANRGIFEARLFDQDSFVVLNTYGTSSLTLRFNSGALLSYGSATIAPYSGQNWLLFPGATAGSAIVSGYALSEAQIVPVPSAAWLLSSGFLGLIGVARRFT